MRLIDLNERKKILIKEILLRFIYLHVKNNRLNNLYNHLLLYMTIFNLCYGCIMGIIDLPTGTINSHQKSHSFSSIPITSLSPSNSYLRQSHHNKNMSITGVFWYEERTHIHTKIDVKISFFKNKYWIKVL